MKSKRKQLKSSRLYVILDKETAGERSIFTITNEIKNSGADIIQFRDKKSKKDDLLKNAYLLRKLLTRERVLFIINDYIDIAKIVDSDGIHLGQNDLSAEIARKILGQNKIIGISCHNLEQAKKAQAQGADYIGLGPIFATPTRPEYKPIGLDLIKEIKQNLKIPFFVIGGINQDNIKEVLFCGSRKVAICRAILEAKNVASRVKYFSQVLH